MSTALLQRLRDVGVEALMDDFGAASFSLTSMSVFPLQGIKIDRSLVHRMGGRRTDLDIVRSTVDLARSCGLGVIAEGVETVSQREGLIAFGCDQGQGYLFAKPLEPKAAGAVLANRTVESRRALDRVARRVSGSLSLSSLSPPPLPSPPRRRS